MVTAEASDFEGDFMHRKTTRELLTTCKCNFMALRALTVKKMHWQGGNM
jgi:hypothetical protein